MKSSLEPLLVKWIAAQCNFRMGINQVGSKLKTLQHDGGAVLILDWRRRPGPRS